MSTMAADRSARLWKERAEQAKISDPSGWRVAKEIADAYTAAPSCAVLIAAAISAAREGRLDIPCPSDPAQKNRRMEIALRIAEDYITSLSSLEGPALKEIRAVLKEVTDD